MAKKTTIKPKPIRSEAKTTDAADLWVTGESAAPVEPVEEKPKLAKVTMYVKPAQIDAVEDIQFSERKRTGKKPDKSDLFQEALDLLIAKYNGKN